MGKATPDLTRVLDDPKRRLVALSFLMLFVELALIRWSSANVVYLAYFTNFVLLASFLGIGVGFLRGRADRNRFPLAPWALTGYVAFVLLFPVQVSNSGEAREFQGLFGMFALPSWVTLPVIFLAVTVIMALIAEGVARTFREFEPLEAYRLDIVGSIAGIAAFTALAFLGVRPVVWGVVVAGVFWLVLERPLGRRQIAALIALVAFLGLGSLSPLDHWSPYYRVSVSRTTPEGRVGIKVNGLPHQAILPLDDLRKSQPFYLYPYDHLQGNPLGDVLVVGAGNGNDVAVALSMGAQHVDAVEIDPVLQATGERRHPARPYQDPRVTAHIDDGRAFLERTDTDYDLILFALPDSLTLVSGQGSLRLESYLFTQEAMESVRDHLKSDGAFSMYNYYRPFVFDRFAGTMQEVFGHPPCLDEGDDTIGVRQQAVLTVGLRSDSIACGATWAPVLETAVAPATDDRPFPYLQERTVPPFYLVTLALILLASALIVRLVSGPLRAMSSYADLFCMGAAFLLLETKNVVQFALLFGTTWFVNSLVFAGILLAVLAAIEVTRRMRLPDPRVLYALLLFSLVIAYLTPLSAILGLAPVPRFLAAVALAFAPIFLANLIFSQRFKDVGSSTTAFGANLLGAMVGGVLEYAALVTGYRALLIVVAVLYGSALLLGRRAGTSSDVGEHVVIADDVSASVGTGSTAS